MLNLQVQILSCSEISAPFSSFKVILQASNPNQELQIAANVRFGLVFVCHCCLIGLRTRKWAHNLPANPISGLWLWM